MSQNYWILLIVIEPLILYLIAYSTNTVARKWAKNVMRTCEELSSELPALSRKFRKELRSFNYNTKKHFIVQPLAMAEITSILGEIGAELIKSRMPVLSGSSKFMFVPILYKLWKLRRRIAATFIQKVTRSAY